MGFFDDVGDAFGSAGSWIGNAAEDSVGWIKGDVGSWIGDAASEAGGWLKGAGETVWGGIKDVAPGVWNEAKSFIGPIYSTFKTTLLSSFQRLQNFTQIGDNLLGFLSTPVVTIVVAILAVILLIYYGPILLEKFG
jgi:hypothetical protein